ncbi:MAG: FG-GAP repeat domain-containing protein, partial [bacterium]
IKADLVGVQFSSVAWADYDGDTDLDLLLTGEDSTLTIYKRSSSIRDSTGTPITKIYRNDGGSFRDSGINLPGVKYSAVAWADYDNDHDPDILLTGQSIIDSTLITISRIYRNDGGTFSDIEANLAGAYFSAVDWGDYDRDNDPDILLSGTISKVYRNNGNSFKEDEAIFLTPVSGGSVRWGDYENDGDLDILLAGSWYTTIYRNEAGNFTEVLLSGGTLNSVDWGDYDNDGDLDILISSCPYSKIYRNDGGNFINTGILLEGVFDGSADWGDYDNDGDLDILITNRFFSSKVYRNDGGVFVDTEAPLIGFIGHGGAAAWGDYDNDGDLDILLAGDIGIFFDFPITRLFRYDHGSFTLIDIPLVDVSYGDVAWGDYDSDGDLDILLTGRGHTHPITRVYRNDGGKFANIHAGLLDLFGGSVAWGDYDNDGDLDILITGQDSLNAPYSKIYRNDAGTFVDLEAGLASVSGGSAEWGDYDNDGDLDILLAGRDAPLQPLAR